MHHIAAIFLVITLSASPATAWAKHADHAHEAGELVAEGAVGVRPEGRPEQFVCEGGLYLLRHEVLGQFERWFAPL